MAIKGDKKKVGLYLSGQSVPIPECNILLSQPTINQIVAFGEDNFTLGVSLLSHTGDFNQRIKQGNSDLDIYSDFQLLLIMIREDNTIKPLLSSILEFLFPDFDKIIIEDNTINFFILDEETENLVKVGVVHPYNFEYLQHTLSDLFEPQNNSEPDYNPANDLAAQIAEKLKEGRERAKKARAGESSSSVFAQYASILSIGLSMDIRILFEYTPFQLYDAFVRYFMKVSSDYYQKLQATPLMDVSKMTPPEEWNQDLYK